MLSEKAEAATANASLRRELAELRASLKSSASEAQGAAATLQAELDQTRASLAKYKTEVEEAEAQMVQVKKDALAELTEADAHSKKLIEAKLKRQVSDCVCPGLRPRVVDQWSMFS